MFPGTDATSGCQGRESATKSWGMGVGITLRADGRGYRIEVDPRTTLLASAAIANAVYHATGIRVRDLPITPAKLVR